MFKRLFLLLSLLLIVTCSDDSQFVSTDGGSAYAMTVPSMLKKTLPWPLPDKTSLKKIGKKYPEIQPVRFLYFFHGSAGEVISQDIIIRSTGEVALTINRIVVENAMCDGCPYDMEFNPDTESVLQPGEEIKFTAHYTVIPDVWVKGYVYIFSDAINMPVFTIVLFGVDDSQLNINERRNAETPPPI